MAISKETIEKYLSNIPDPYSPKDIISSGRVKNIRIDDKNIQLMFALPEGKSEQFKQQLNIACISVLNKHLPDYEVHLQFEKVMADQKEPGVLPQVKNIIAVASGKGGVGKSTISTNLAVGLKREGYRVGLLDADLYGPSIPRMFGVEGQRPQVREVYGQAKIVPLVANGIYVMSIGFIVEPEQAVVLRGPRLGGIIKQFIEDCLWPDLDFLIIDLPPGTGDIQLTMVQTVPVTGAVIVTTPQKVAYDDALKAMNMFLLSSINVPILGIVENMAWFTPAELPDHKYYLFGKGGGARLAEKAGSVLLGQVPLVQSVMEGCEDGTPAMEDSAGEYGKAMQLVITSLLRELARRHQLREPTQTVKIKS